MANDFGLSFVPTDQGMGQQPGRPGAVGGTVSPVQQAIQLLSLRLPHVFGAQALAPGPLLTSAGGGGMSAGPGGGSLEAILRLLFGQQAGRPGPGPLGLPTSPMGGPTYTPVPTKPIGWGNAPDHWPGPTPLPRMTEAPWQPTPTTIPLPRVTPGIVPRVPGPAEAPPPQLPTPKYMPVPTKPMGWGNAPDHWPGPTPLPRMTEAPWQPTPNDFGMWGI